jgi:hypothetical protein
MFVEDMTVRFAKAYPVLGVQTKTQCCAITLEDILEMD